MTATLFDPGPDIWRALPPGWRRAEGGTVYQVDSGHIGTHITHGQREAWVDAPMAPLILELWRSGIATVSCCQADDEDGGLANVVFPGATHVEKFLTRVGLFTGRMMKPGMSWPRHPAGTYWRFDSWPYEERTGDVVLFTAAAFPRDDLPDLVRRLQERAS